MPDEPIPLYSLELVVRDPDKLLFKGLVSSVTAVNEKGPFDVLPIHENFITIIKDKIIVKAKDGVQEFVVKKGILKVEENEVEVFLNAESI